MAQKPKEELTPAQAIQEIRNLRRAKLFVSNMEMVDVLLAEYDKALAGVEELASIRAELALARQPEAPQPEGQG
jgi:hypothetical protein